MSRQFLRAAAAVLFLSALLFPVEAGTSANVLPLTKRDNDSSDLDPLERLASDKRVSLFFNSFTSSCPDLEGEGFKDGRTEMWRKIAGSIMPVSPFVSQGAVDEKVDFVAIGDLTPRVANTVKIREHLLDRGFEQKPNRLTGGDPTIGMEAECGQWLATPVTYETEENSQKFTVVYSSENRNNLEFDSIGALSWFDLEYVQRKPSEITKGDEKAEEVRAEMKPVGDALTQSGVATFVNILSEFLYAKPDSPLNMYLRNFLGYRYVDVVVQKPSKKSILMLLNATKKNSWKADDMRQALLEIRDPQEQKEVMGKLMHKSEDLGMKPGYMVLPELDNTFFFFQRALEEKLKAAGITLTTSGADEYVVELATKRRKKRLPPPTTLELDTAPNCGIQVTADIPLDSIWELYASALGKGEEADANMSRFKLLAGMSVPSHVRHPLSKVLKMLGPDGNKDDLHRNFPMDFLEWSRADKGLAIILMSYIGKWGMGRKMDKAGSFSGSGNPSDVLYYHGDPKDGLIDIMFRSSMPSIIAAVKAYRKVEGKGGLPLEWGDEGAMPLLKTVFALLGWNSDLVEKALQTRIGFHQRPWNLNGFTLEEWVTAFLRDNYDLVALYEKSMGHYGVIQRPEAIYIPIEFRSAIGFEYPRNLSYYCHWGRAVADYSEVMRMVFPRRSVGATDLVDALMAHDMEKGAKGAQDDDDFTGLDGLAAQIG